MMIFLFVLSISCLGTSEYSEETGRIWNGQAARENQFPYHVIIKGKSGGHYCGGSIIDKNWVVTAAHCFPKLKPGTHSEKQIRGQFGGHATFRSQDYDIVFDTVIIHEMYCTMKEVVTNDIALLKATKPMVSDDPKIIVQSIQLPEQFEEFKTGTAIVSGAGKTKHGEVSRRLLFVELKLFSDTECMKLLRIPYGSPTWFYPESMICAGGDPKDSRVIDACPGDSGGPLAFRRRDGNYVLIGVVSFGQDCRKGMKNEPGIYTEVSLYTNWIYDKTGKGGGEGKVVYPDCTPHAVTPGMGSANHARNRVYIHSNQVIMMLIAILLCNNK